MATKRRPAGTPGLGSRGSALMRDLQDRFKDDPAGQALLLEACRMADRLDALHEAIATKGVLELMHFRLMLGTGDGVKAPIKVEIHFDSVLAEARQQENTFRLLLGQIAPVVAAGKPADAPPAPSGEARPTIDQLATRRAEAAAAKNRAQAAE